jgi:hypothetical protein
MPRMYARPDQSAFNKVALNLAFCKLSRTPHPGQPSRPFPPLPRCVPGRLLGLPGRVGDRTDLTFSPFIRMIGVSEYGAERSRDSEQWLKLSSRNVSV